MKKNTMENSFDYLKDLLIFPKENEMFIITIMVRDNISIPKILPAILKEKPEVQKLLFKSLCDLTGYSFDNLLENKPELVKRFRKEYPDECKGCGERKKQWSEKFKKVVRELKYVKEASASMNFSTELNVSASGH